MKAIIHIGMAKAGSTSIQTWLNVNRSMLKTLGVHSIERMSLCGGNTCAVRCAVYIWLREMGVEHTNAWIGPRRPSENAYNEIEANYKILSSKLHQISERAGVFVYSNENLFCCTDIQMIAMDNIISKYFHERTYVLYIRNIVDTLVSLYSEKLRGKWKKTNSLNFLKALEMFTNQHLAIGELTDFKRIYVWDRMLAKNLNVRLLENDWLVNANLIQDFASLVGVDELRKFGNVNISISANYIEYIRFMNQQDSLPEEYRMKALRILTDLSHGKPKLALSESQAKWIEEKYREIEDWIRVRFFNTRPYLFSPKIRGRGIMPIPLTDRRKVEIIQLLLENDVDLDQLPLP